MIKKAVRIFLRPYFRNCIKKSISKMDGDTAVIANNYSSSKLTQEEKNKVINFWEGHFGYKPGFSYFELTKEIDSFNPEYVPDSIYYRFILPNLNRRYYSFALSDKGIIDYYFNNIRRPKEVVKNINGNYIKNGTLISREDAILTVFEYKSPMIIKPSIDSSCGKNVLIINDLTDKSKVEEILNSYVQDYVVQELIQQSELTAHFNPTSLNTFRITTLLLNNNFSVLSCCFRCGGLNACVDNTGAGGIMVGLDEKGVMHKNGYTKNGEIRYQSYVGQQFENYQFPHFYKIIDLAKELHSLLPFCPVVGWDIALDKDNNPILIEVNLKSPGILFEQMCTGPIFGNRLNEVLDYVKK